MTTKAPPRFICATKPSWSGRSTMAGAVAGDLGALMPPGRGPGQEPGGGA